ncbi:MAG: LapA family protein [Alphaproteobacteria bacterium]|nr:LapA family protein [Alphaproteobacteria bacterium]
MKIVFWAFAFAIVVFTIDLVMTNNQMVTFESWLLSWRTELPLGLTVLLGLAVGIFIGGLVSWFGSGRAWWRARGARKKVETLEQELTGLARRAESAERDAINSSLPSPSDIPPGNGSDRADTSTAAERS